MRGVLLRSRISRVVRRWLVAWAVVSCLSASPDAAAHTGETAGFWVASARGHLRVGRVDLYYEPELAGEAAFLQEELPAWWAAVEADLAGDLDDTLTIYLVEHAGTVASATGMPRWVAGVARPETGEIVVARHGPDGNRTDLVGLVRHEMAHVALQRAVRGRKVPRWLHEGLAENLEGKVSLARSEALAGAVFGPGIPEMADLERAFASEDPAQVTVAYAAARDFVAFLRGYDADGARFRQFLYELGRGYTLDAAALRAYGEPLETLVQSWRLGLPGRFVWFALVAGGGVPFAFFTPLVFLAWWRRRRLVRAGLARLAREDRLSGGGEGYGALPAGCSACRAAP